MTYEIARTSQHTVTFANGQELPWYLLRAAARQPDRDLAVIYSGILGTAEKMEDARIADRAAADEASYGDRVKAGYDLGRNGQIVSSAWEIRRRRDPAGTAIGLQPIIVTLDRSRGCLDRAPGPVLRSMMDCYEWLRVSYGGWHEELSGDRATAAAWLY